MASSTFSLSFALICIMPYSSAFLAKILNYELKFKNN